MRRGGWLLAAALLILVALFLLLVPSWFWHPLGYCTGTAAQVRGCKGYNSWSGSFSDIGEITLLVGLVTGAVAVRRFLHQHFECHETDCRKLGFHHVEGTHYRTCWRHHPVLSVHEHHKVPAAHIKEMHRRAEARKQWRRP